MNELVVARINGRHEGRCPMCSAEIVTSSEKAHDAAAEHDARITMLFGGRPCRLKRIGREWFVLVMHELADCFVMIELSDADMEMPSHEFTERYVNPAIKCLEQAIFPHRMDRMIAAARKVAERC